MNVAPLVLRSFASRVDSGMLPVTLTGMVTDRRSFSATGAPSETLTVTVAKLELPAEVLMRYWKVAMPARVGVKVRSLPLWINDPLALPLVCGVVTSLSDALEAFWSLAVSVAKETGKDT